MIKLFAVMLGVCFSMNVWSAPGPVVPAIDWKTLYQQIFYWNIWKNADPAKTDLVTLREHSIYYSPLNPNEIYRQIVNARTSEEALAVRERLLGFSSNRKELEGNKSIYLSQVRGISALAASSAKNLLAKILNERLHKVSVDTNYFNTDIGREVANSLADTLMIIVPGFGSHTILDYTYPEIVEDANLYYGRPKVRKPSDVTGEHGEKLFIGESSPQNFYSLREGSPEHGFDIVHPMGSELGNSMGKDAESAEHLKNWIENLPAHYANKKLIFVGYSKGTPISHNVVKLFPSIRKRTKMIVTIAGVNQGSIAAEEGTRLLTTLTNSQTPQEGLEKMREIREDGKSMLSTLLDQTSSRGVSFGVMGMLWKQLSLVFPALATLKKTKQLDKAIEGIIDLSNYERIKWNLAYLNDENFDQPITIMNLSVITNLEDFFLPGRVADQDLKLRAPLTVPQFQADGTIDYLHYSRDAVFLHLSSVTGFAQAAGGLFDTQVAWMDAKAMALDERSLLESLRGEQIDRIHNELFDLRGKGLPADFKTLPRNQLLTDYNRSLGVTMKNLKFVDLGDVRGTHWDIAFRQVYKPVPEGYYEHTFPRRAALTALLETIALYEKSFQTPESSRGLQ